MPESHLPECPFGGDTDYSWLDECICDNLRACEARVAAETISRLDRWQQNSPLGRKTYEEGLKAARDAVAALDWKVAVEFGPIDCDSSCEHGPCSCSGVTCPTAWMTGPDDALAAIDALRGES